MIKAVVFDFDMTLADSSYAITDCTNRLAQEHGLRKVTREEVLKTIGMPIRDSWLQLWGEFKEEWLTQYRGFFVEQEYAGIRLFPGTVMLLESLRNKGIRLAVASNRQNARPVVESQKLDGFFEHIIGIQDVEHPKPAPDILHKSMELLDAAPEEIFYVGDTDLDMMTSVAAGVRGVGLTTGNFSSHELKNSGAYYTFDKIEDILTLF
ncbi:MAG: HAD-IA family hydrolase [Aminobacterium sp.]|uniref:HAD family hydrolase n=1 Tax=unclassified Aminobacterium TaxID=2685012 RepID=UPI001BCD00FE|nr:MULTISPECIES: HAD-IA family hydrolase [unclassified Aminobacterium]MDD2206043.1 HAD-IA family hydrolase [Aminobacterium sp.]MDD3425615.1 HAD-IA family hydrolase [Aminobacterium sp.]MDD3708030.1 HAD-IA family hydrolase [Aminobacterium sp.]MDD4227800.1 HAD-IA family hydrolase [Aminobacterium sp.]MDD4550760.1 HAD-IA family hydrolase [Aminobacterium sp.]